MFSYMFIFTRYATFIVKHPYILLAFISVLVILSGCFSLIPQLGAKPLPDFDEPIKVCKFEQVIFAGADGLVCFFVVVFLYKHIY